MFGTVVCEISAAIRSGNYGRAGYIAKNFLPSGSGFDCGTTLDIDRSDARKIILYADFHHMNSNGCYDGWSTNKIVVRPEFDEFSVKIQISGRKLSKWEREQQKDFVYLDFYHALRKKLTNEEVREIYEN